MDALVSMQKGADTLEVHPSCVNAHALQGWRLTPAAPAQPKPDTAAQPIPRAPRVKKPT